MQNTWRESLVAQGQSASTVHARLSALSSLCRELVSRQLMERNPVREVKREKLRRERGITPALLKKQARKLLDAPPRDTLQGLRDRAILAVGLHVGPRRAEIAKLRVKDDRHDEGYRCLLLRRKKGTESTVAIHPETVARIEAYLLRSGHRGDPENPLFLPVKTSQEGLEEIRELHPQQVHRVFQTWARRAKLKVGPGGFRSHSMRATAGTHAIKNGAEISDVRYMLGHADIRTTLLYDRRKNGPENSASFATNYGEAKQSDDS